MLAQLMVEGAAETTARQVAKRLAAADTRLGTLLRRRDHLSDEIERGRLGRLQGSAGGSSPKADIAALNDVQQTIATEFPDFSPQDRAKPMSRYDLGKLLRPAEAGVLIHTSEAATDVFVVDGKSLHWHRSAIGKAEMTQIVAHLREGLDPTGGVRGAKTLVADTARQAFDAEAAQELYQRLFGELDAVLGDRELQVVADGPLAALPLSVLVTEPLQEGQRPRWLVMRSAVSCTAVAVDATPARHPRPRNGGDRLRRFRRRGLPVRSRQWHGYPRRSRNGAPRSPDPCPARGARSKRSVRSFRKPNELNFLASRRRKQPSRLPISRVARWSPSPPMDWWPAISVKTANRAWHSRSRPKRSAADDGFLTASEAATLNIDADWLLLSACNTAASDGNPDSGGYAGLARAFLFAGARSILVRIGRCATTSLRG